MSPKRYPVSSGRDLVKALKKIGYQEVSQKGSHLKLYNFYQGKKHIIVIPLHKELDRGTLRSIIRKVGFYYPPEKLLGILKGKS